MIDSGPAQCQGRFGREVFLARSIQKVVAAGNEAKFATELIPPGYLGYGVRTGSGVYPEHMEMVAQMAAGLADSRVLSGRKYILWTESRDFVPG
jgi:hypothetical protein